jgi:hypothetical protein
MQATELKNQCFLKQDIITVTRPRTLLLYEEISNLTFLPNLLKLILAAALSMIQNFVCHEAGKVFTTAPTTTETLIPKIKD